MGLNSQIHGRWQVGSRDDENMIFSATVAKIWYFHTGQDRTQPKYHIFKGMMNIWYFQQQRPKYDIFRQHDRTWPKYHIVRPDQPAAVENMIFWCSWWDQSQSDGLSGNISCTLPKDYLRVYTSLVEVMLPPQPPKGEWPLQSWHDYDIFKYLLNSTVQYSTVQCTYSTVSLTSHCVV